MWDAENNNEHIILPCPFCGGKAEPDTNCTEDLEYCLQCDGCGCSIYFDNREGDDYKLRVIRAWNRRTDVSENS
jgi:hypothetical protein